MTKTPCKHLEALLPRDSQKSVEKIATLKDIAAMDSETMTAAEFEEHCLSLHNRLTQEYKLNKTTATLVIDRFVSGLSIKELAAQTGMSTLTLSRVLALAVKELKNKGVSFGLK